MDAVKVYAVYFSPAGGTKQAAERVAAQLAAHMGVPWEAINYTRPAARGEKRRFAPDDLVVFGTPTYAGRVPNKILPFLRELFGGQNTPAVAVVTFGNRSFDSSLTELAEELAQEGFCPFAAGAFAVRHVFSDKIGAGRPDASDLDAMDALAARAAEKLKAAPPGTLRPAVIKGGAPVAPYYTPLGRDGAPVNFLKAKPETDPALCDGCGVCAAVCPLGSIDPENVFSVPGVCIKCQACVRRCPQHAKQFTDAAFLSHVAMLEENYTRRAEPELYL